MTIDAAGDPTPLVVDHPDAHRYEATVDGELAGFAAYRMPHGAIVFTHTLVEPAYEGRGVGGALARFALDDARSRGLEIIVVCPFIRAWIERHPDYADLIAPETLRP